MTVDALPSYGTVMRHLEAWLATELDQPGRPLPIIETLAEDVELWRAAGKPEELPWRTL